MIKDLIMQEIESQIKTGKLTSKDELLKTVIEIEKKLLEDEKLITLLSSKGMTLKEGDYKEYIETLLNFFDKNNNKVDNITTFKTDNEEMVEFKKDNQYSVANNYTGIKPQDQLNAIKNANLKNNKLASDEDVFNEYSKKNQTYDFYNIEARKGYEMNQDELKNLNIFISSIIEEGLNVNDYNTTFDCSKYINTNTGDIYAVQDGKLISLKKEEINSEPEESKTISNEEQEMINMSNEELQTKLDKYNDEELVDLYETLNNQELKEIVRKMVSSDFELDIETNKFKRVVAPKVYVLNKNDFNKAAFVNILILSLISFGFSILMILLILIKYNL